MIVIGCLGFGGCSPSGAPAGDAAAASVVGATEPIGAARHIEIDDIPIGQPSSNEPVVAAAAVFPAQATPGSEVTLAIRIRIGAGWHIFALGPKSQSPVATPTTLDTALPPGIAPVAEWLAPPGEWFRDATGQGRVYRDEILLTRRLKIAAVHPGGTVELPCTIGCQACNDQMCVRVPPRTLKPVVEIVAR